VRRARRIAKWTGLTLALLIAAAWTVSLWWAYGYVWVYPTGLRRVALFAGCIECGTYFPARFSSDGLETGWRASRHTVSIRWLPRGVHSPLPGATSVTVPGWIPFLLLAIPTAWLFWIERRARPGHCRCGYDLAGLPPDAACPECGSQRDSETARQRDRG
jgi:hypothetical protein